MHKALRPELFGPHLHLGETEAWEEQLTKVTPLVSDGKLKLRQSDSRSHVSTNALPNDSCHKNIQSS